MLSSSFWEYEYLRPYVRFFRYPFRFFLRLPQDEVFKNTLSFWSRWVFDTLVTLHPLARDYQG